MKLSDYKKIAIICDGTEISYGMTLLHLFKYEDEKQSLLSKKGEIIVPELYSVKAFERANVKKNVLKIYYSGSGITTDETVIDKYGITIRTGKDSLVCLAPSAELSDKDYGSFITDANKELKKYNAGEAEYIDEIPANWIISGFSPVAKAGLFGKKDAEKKKKQQYYDFLSLYMYNEILLG